MSVTSVPGFVASGVAAGIKESAEPDVALIATEDGQPVTAAGIFTSNKLLAAPVVVTKAHLQATHGEATAVIINSGNANAGLGERGVVDAETMCSETAQGLGVASEQVLVCSTGVIGYRLPIEVVKEGIASAVSALNDEGGLDAATAMMTTDTVAKHCLLEAVDSQGTKFHVGGVAKGAAMLEPNMATMLAVLTTDATLGPAAATLMLQHGAESAFNSLTIDGAQSTNDTVLLLANGRAGQIEKEALQQAVDEAMMTLALMMADDAEGSTKTVFVDVVNAVDRFDALRVARGIANSQLIKCSWYGQDPYWGRIASEVGVRSSTFDAARLVISYGDQVVYDRGLPVKPDSKALKAVMSKRRITLTVDLGQGSTNSRVITTDLAPGYIAENKGTS